MRTNQRTIKWKTEYEGTGLHTGNHSTITFLPAAPNAGVRFIRTDLPEKPVIPASIDYVDDCNRGTTLKKDGVEVHTVEHVMAAIAGLEIDNIDIEITNNEPPVGDGSAMPFVMALQNAGFEDQNAPRNYLVVDETVSYKDAKRETEIVALPLDDFRVTLMIDFHNPALGSQHSGLFSLEEEFVTEFAPSRTFCFLRELEMLYDAGLIKGSNMESALVIVDEQIDEDEIERLKKKIGLDDQIKLGTTGILDDRKLRFKNEPCRHKLLDLLGDIYLIGVPVRAQILAARSGHHANIEFAKKLKKLYDKQKLTQKYQDVPKTGIIFDITAIEKIMPHRYPFLLVDKITEMELGKRIVGIKNVTRNEEFFNGHFPNYPIMPGVLIIEAMAQTGGIMLLNETDNPENKMVLFAGINNAKFKSPVIPGDQLTFELRTINKRRSIYKMSGKAFVDGKLVCEAELSAAIVNK